MNVNIYDAWNTLAFLFPIRQILLWRYFFDIHTIRALHIANRRIQRTDQFVHQATTTKSLISSINIQVFASILDDCTESQNCTPLLYVSDQQVNEMKHQSNRITIKIK